MMKTFKVKSRDEQRKSQAGQLMAAVTLELQLRALVHKALVDHDASAAVEFQQMIQYAPEDTRLRIARLIEAGGER